MDSNKKTIELQTNESEEEIKFSKVKAKLSEEKERLLSIMEEVSRITREIKVLETDVCDSCPGHRFKRERETGIYGEIWDICSKCGMNRSGVKIN